MDKKQEEALQSFLLDIDCLKSLDKWTNQFNIFDVLKITNAEIRHSNILGWLLDPNGSHKLGDSFIRAFISIIIRNNKSNNDSINLLLQDFYSYSVLREHNHMDLILLSRQEKTAYIIENKIWAGESSNHQLKDYYNISHEEYNGYNLIYAFLSPYGRESSDTEHWISISYDEIIDSLEEIINSSNTDDEVKVLVNNYINAVRKEIMGEKDTKLIEICNEIYNKHKEALKLIFQNVNMDKSVESEIICNVLRDYASKGKIVYSNDNTWYFFTERMSNYLPDIDEEKSSWETKWIYYYFFEKYNDRIIIHLEIGGWGISDEILEKMKLLMKYSKEIKNKVNQVIPFRYKRLYTKTLSLSEDDYEKSIEKQARKLIDLALDNEDELFKRINDYK